MIITNWNVLTGAPGSGKTTLVESLAKLNFATACEAARDCILKLLAVQQGMQPFDQAQLQKDIFSAMEAREQNLSPEELHFFDRGLPDSMAYYRFHQLDLSELRSATQKYRYKNVFYCHELPIKNDSVRIENQNEAHLIGQYIRDAYIELGYSLIELPPVSVEERMEIILTHLEILPLDSV